MLRLIALAVLLPSIAEAQLPDPKASPEPYVYRPGTLRTPPLKPADVAVPPEEHALRDWMPGWVPCRALTEDEMAWADSPHQMVISGFFFPGKARGKPVIPTSWTPGWPEPGPLLATGVPRGWWWRPANPEWFGAWLVLGQGGAKGHRFFMMATAPMTYAKHGSVPEHEPILALYAALRDREAKRRGVDPAALDAESERLAQGGYAAPPSVIGQAIEQAKALDRRGDFAEAAALLEITLDDGGGTDAERIRGLRTLGQLMGLLERYPEARAAYMEARGLADRAGAVEVVGDLDRRLVNVSAVEGQPEHVRQGIRGIAHLKRGLYAEAIAPLQAAAAGFEPGSVEALGMGWRLAVALEKIGDTPGAQAQAAQALALAERLDDAEVAAKMKALLARLGPAPAGRD